MQTSPNTVPHEKRKERKGKEEDEMWNKGIKKE